MTETSLPPARQHWLLDGIPPEQIRPLLEHAQEVRFIPGELIFEEGDAADGLYLITGGSVGVTARDASGAILLATIPANDVLGEMGVLDGEPRTGTATAQGLCTAYFIPTEPFLDSLEMSNQLCMRLLALLARRLRFTDRRLSDAPGARAISPSSPELVTDDLGGGLSFADWLADYIHSAGAIGEIARYADDDRTWPSRATSIDAIHQHLDALDADERLHLAANVAWESWELSTRRSQPSGGFEDFE